jgi:hypothetical protein
MVGHWGITFMPAQVCGLCETIEELLCVVTSVKHSARENK